MKCSYCSKEIKKGTGLVYIFKNGKANYYCSNRCYVNNIKLRRKANSKETRQYQDTSRIIKPETSEASS
jgi:ribosomal protein L24E